MSGSEITRHSQRTVHHAHGGLPLSVSRTYPHTDAMSGVDSMDRDTSISVTYEKEFDASWGSSVSRRVPDTSYQLRSDKSCGDEYRAGRKFERDNVLDCRLLRWNYLSIQYGRLLRCLDNDNLSRLHHQSTSCGKHLGSRAGLYDQHFRVAVCQDSGCEFGRGSRDLKSCNGSDDRIVQRPNEQANDTDSLVDVVRNEQPLVELGIPGFFNESVLRQLLSRHRNHRISFRRTGGHCLSRVRGRLGLHDERNGSRTFRERTDGYSRGRSHAQSNQHCTSTGNSSSRKVRTSAHPEQHGYADLHVSKRAGSASRKQLAFSGGGNPSRTEI